MYVCKYVCMWDVCKIILFLGQWVLDRH